MDVRAGCPFQNACFPRMWRAWPKFLAGCPQGYPAKNFLFGLNFRFRLKRRFHRKGAFFFTVKGPRAVPKFHTDTPSPPPPATHKKGEFTENPRRGGRGRAGWCLCGIWGAREGRARPLYREKKAPFRWKRQLERPRPSLITGPSIPSTGPSVLLTGLFNYLIVGRGVRNYYLNNSKRALSWNFLW